MEGSRLHQWVIVKILTLDKFVETLHLPYVSFIKIDVEGAAHKVLKGGTTVLKTNNCSLAIAAYHSRCELNESVRILTELGYRIRVENKTIYAQRK